MIKKYIACILISFFILCNCNLCFGNTETIQLHSESALLFDSNTGKVIYEKNATKKMYPASTTKILTAILALENSKLTDKVIVEPTPISLVPEGYSSANLKQGEELSMEQLLNVLLIHSANDAANVIAFHIDGSIEKFAERMNRKAKEINCQNSNFTNPSGEHNENHYTTAADLSKIAKYCMQNETFRSIVKSPSYTMVATNLSPSRYFSNTNQLLLKVEEYKSELTHETSSASNPYYYAPAIGIKTGYTKQAKNCLVSASNQNGFELICIVLGADQTEDGLNYRFLDSKALFEYGYQNYELKTISQKDLVLSSLQIKNGTKETKYLDAVSTKEITIVISKNEEQNLSPIINWNENLVAPITKGEVIGTATYQIGSKKYEQNIVATHNVEAINYMNYIYFGVLVACILLIFSLVIYYFLQRNKNKEINFNDFE